MSGVSSVSGVSKRLARPHDLHHGAVVGELAVGEGDFGAGPLQQRAGDEDAKPEPGMLALVGARPPRQIGLADPLQHVGRDAGAVVGDHDLDGLAVPPRVDLDRVAGEVDGVLQDVADAVEDRGIARADRLAGRRDRDAHLDVDAEIAMRRHRLLDQRRQLHAVERRAGGGELGDLGQDVAAALRLFAQRLQVGGERAVAARSSPARARSGRWSTAACRVHGRQRRQARRAGSDAVRVSAPVRWRRARRRAFAIPR